MGVVPGEGAEETTADEADPVDGQSGPVVAWSEPTPTYARPWFVAAVVAGCVAAGFVIWLIGNSGNVNLGSDDGELVQLPTPGVGAGETPEPGRREDCPEPGAAVEYEAAELVQLFGASATGGGFGDLAASQAVLDLLEERAPSPTVTRMTLIGGWFGENGQWSTCVLSSWIGTNGPMQSIDIVTASVVSGSDRSDAGDDEDDEDLPDRWEVTGWLRGVPESPPPTRAVSIAFFNSKRACRGPDRSASVPVEDGDQSFRLLQALEELGSGTPGRANSATTKVPADMQVIEAAVVDGRARVVLTPTSDELSKCDGTASWGQVHDTAAAIAAEALPEGADEPEVEIVIDGADVDTLRR